ncbi:MAG TPA: glucose-6-phosphate dehydrogenase assembly protein OpcA [Chlamydiales bacterium]|nr:glucose-6-phosphate dehydrogenase assembly protein OpcA [Chlamydiales bacterium]
MSIQQIVKPEAIESQLKEIWEKLAQENKMRACLFNLIIFNRYSARTDYIRSIVQKVIDKFPCRVLFISEDPNHQEPYLKTAIGVRLASETESTIACDYIDIGVAGTELERVPYLLLPHLLPDLPVTLLWTEDPSVFHPLFEPFTQFAHRIIFDSESADNLLEFSQTVLALNEKGHDVADLNWARIEGWRDLITSLFNNPDRRTQLQNLKELTILYNARPTEFFCHLKIQSMYLLSWLAARLQWTYESAHKESSCLRFIFTTLSAAIESTKWEQLGPGTIISVRFNTNHNERFDCARIQERYHHVAIQISSPDKCDLPYQYILGQTATGHSLVKEICMKGSSNHYLEMLKGLSILDKERLC